MHLANLYRYPVKGLTPEPLERAILVAGETLPCDRAWAIENGPGRFDPSQPRHLPKINFLMLMRDERLATLRSNFDDATETLTILRDGKQVARGKLTTPLGRQLIEQFIAAYMKAEL
ncbi:MAG TPA: MOSC N-terminal beta barrel domain-containing protein, partial [Hyphomicrobiaceae bacterium]|nr:MOSC N-terminal beta barrel domain-containing protein [Hyphomicrobiaceae bacterium]